MLSAKIRQGLRDQVAGIRDDVAQLRAKIEEEEVERDEIQKRINKLGLEIGASNEAIQSLLKMAGDPVEEDPVLAEIAEVVGSESPPDDEHVDDPDPDFDSGKMKPKESEPTPEPEPEPEPGPEPEENLPPPRQRRAYPEVEKKCGSCGLVVVVRTNRKKCPKCEFGQMSPTAPPLSERPRPPSAAVKRKKKPAPVTPESGNAKPYRGQPSTSKEVSAAEMSDHTKAGPGKTKKKCVKCGRIAYVSAPVTGCPN